MNKTLISQRVEALRHWMKAHQMHAFVIPSTDAHASEYVPQHWASREWISGFNGSAGTAVVTLHDAALWTDSRYFLAAADQLADTPFQLMKERVEGTPTIATWLCSQLQSGDIVGIDGQVNAVCDADALREVLHTKGILLNLSTDPLQELWGDRPALPKDKITIQPLEFAGEDVASKLARLTTKLREQGADTMVVSALDEVAWLLNLRGTDVHCNPVFVAYCLVLPKKVTLYVDKDKIGDDVRDYLFQNHITVEDYNRLTDDLEQLHNHHMLLSPQTNAIVAEIAARNNHVSYLPSPIATMKAIKNATEIEGFHRAMLRDGVAMVKFLRRLLPAVKAGGLTEMGVDRLLTSLRAEQPLFKDISFDTIAAYADHGAIVHYEATPETDCELQPKGFLLLDSGAQYQDGTTDITRTISLREPTEEEKHIYTLVLKGHIALSRTKFPKGAAGTQLDLSARYAMWQEGFNFGHGTGHGVGSYLNVHEGPHQIRMNWMPAPIVEGMTVTDEPGIYVSGHFGVRTENVLLAVPYKQTDFGEFLAFEPLTLCPIDTKPIDCTMLSPEEILWLNQYHQHVCQQLLPLLDHSEDRDWLCEATKPIRL